MESVDSCLNWDRWDLGMGQCIVGPPQLLRRVVEYHVVMAAREAVIESEWASASSFAHKPASS